MDESRWSALHPCEYFKHEFVIDDWLRAQICTRCGWTEKEVSEFSQREFEDWENSYGQE